MHFHLKQVAEASPVEPQVKQQEAAAFSRSMKDVGELRMSLAIGDHCWIAGIRCHTSLGSLLQRLLPDARCAMTAVMRRR